MFVKRKEYTVLKMEIECILKYIVTLENCIRANQEKLDKLSSNREKDQKEFQILSDSFKSIAILHADRIDAMASYLKVQYKDETREIKSSFKGYKKSAKTNK